ncbi:1-(5-phosphoribosyl)-5-[(5-phosphoribosylamino)methylideneamino] imidazole-4-carboxamide isomerase [Chryseobacterium sp. Leaf180]|uniref:1-(5-phosphoribosyl)-5-[(5- phosphoribosylamino)methylideneamino]imidazole-4- carboxamide isomerase n=1 Tax=Chryseobacterium sp. Leaf180 TaxID=1736289 RepID=UPI0006F8F85F|nr:1-(5-phosphoribosyl)-5-[(5-phosphoribosylamino)methylideneamino]imidazole-4-carboxamide isomerase [Chryseobacterium sp. Leaf180]KQR94655.1 1-(5-phosphoribosyl)-5-[(5-phosphoribosylamino)methylideneamino] imidazole-4-carboxamide isomerase [Chryseobacterium sp. Leaf180]
MKIIPAIDIIDGKCVRLSKGDYGTKKIYHENPVEVAKEFENYGIKYLHLVDLDGAKSKQIVNHKILENIAKETSLKIDFGGGLKTENDVKKAFEYGAAQITIGSLAVQNPVICYELIKTFGSEKIILGADCENRKIKTAGWLAESDWDVVDFISFYQKKNIKNVICTDISKDGMLAGAASDLYREILDQTDVTLIASGGISSMDDVYEMKSIGCAGTIIGKAIYEGNISLDQLKNFIENA